MSDAGNVEGWSVAMLDVPEWVGRHVDGTAGGLKADRVRDILRRAILFRVLSPGEQLAEQALANELGCSQSTVREALLRLSDDGLVERRGYRGTFVTETTLDEAAEMLRVRLSIEQTVARRLAVTGLGATTTRIEAVLRQMDEAHGQGDLDRCSVLDRQFHAALAEAAGMGLLRPLVSRCALHIHRFTLMNVTSPEDFYREAGLGDEHRALLAILLGPDPEAAARGIRQHVEVVLERWAPPLHRTMVG
ncbi:MAG: GntR family transcriptional regulator [Pseudomonadota bacterium]